MTFEACKVTQAEFVSELVEDGHNALCDALDDAVHIVDSGSNSNGKWRKWSNGVMEQWGGTSYSVTTSTAGFAGEYVSSVMTQSFPVSFAAAPEIQVSGYPTGSGRRQIAFNPSDVTASGFKWINTTMGSMGSSGVHMSWLAIGTWS